MLKFKELLLVKQREKQQKISKYLTALQKCTKIQFADRLFIRKMLIDKQPKVLSIFEGLEEKVSLEEVQSRLRKLIFNIKPHTPKNQCQSSMIKRVVSQKNFVVQNHFPYSCKNSKQASPNKQEKIKRILLDVGQIRRKLKSKGKNVDEQESKNSNEKYKMRRNHSQKLSFNPQVMSTNRKGGNIQPLSTLRKKEFSATQPVKDIRYACAQIEREIRQFQQQSFGNIQQSCEEENIDLKSLIKEKMKGTNKKAKIRDIDSNKKFSENEIINKEKSNIENTLDSRFGKFYLKIKDIMQGNKCQL